MEDSVEAESSESAAAPPVMPACRSGVLAATPAARRARLSGGRRQTPAPPRTGSARCGAAAGWRRSDRGGNTWRNAPATGFSGQRSPRPSPATQTFTTTGWIRRTWRPTCRTFGTWCTCCLTPMPGNIGAPVPPLKLLQRLDGSGGPGDLPAGHSAVDAAARGKPDLVHMLLDTHAR